MDWSSLSFYFQSRLFFWNVGLASSQKQGSLQLTKNRKYLKCEFCQHDWISTTDYRMRPKDLEQFHDLQNKIVWVQDASLLAVGTDTLSCPRSLWMLTSPNPNSGSVTKFMENTCIPEVIIFQEVALHRNISSTLRYQTLTHPRLGKRDLAQLAGVVGFKGGAGSIPPDPKMYNGMQAITLFYCKDGHAFKIGGNFISNILVWLESFDFWTWIGFLFVMVTCGLSTVFKMSGLKFKICAFIKSQVRFLRECVRQPDPYLDATMISFWLVFILIFYENAITCKLLAPNEPSKFESELSMFQEGYTVLHLNRVPHISLADKEITYDIPLLFLKIMLNLRRIRDSEFTAESLLNGSVVVGEDGIYDKLKDLVDLKQSVMEDGTDYYFTIVSMLSPHRRCHSFESFGENAMFSSYFLQDQESFGRLKRGL
ncbi:hypothetical protein Fcan01_11029 [Folsomia candida]|uniref:Uncharacterized protein n=1 Tax=Folsomia candida TaxID=158441 RepID=A0A226E9F6_FOLCA|nr:hypothetical protein Fcan01_11029 [Folsomia candida]